MTYRERRLAKAERYRQWAEKRDTKAEAAYSTAKQISDSIPFGQPILVGHHSEARHRRDIGRFDSNMSKSIEHSDKADSMRSKADNIEAAAARAIYDDDPDAIERLTAKIERGDKLRASINAFNKSCRSGKPDLSLLDAAMQRNHAQLGRIQAGLRADGSFPPYMTSNLSGTLNRDKKRLARLQRQAQQ